MREDFIFRYIPQGCDLTAPLRHTTKSWQIFRFEFQKNCLVLSIQCRSRHAWKQRSVTTRRDSTHPSFQESSLRKDGWVKLMLRSRVVENVQKRWVWFAHRVKNEIQIIIVKLRISCIYVWISKSITTRLSTPK